jgi:hypothetical protein
MLIGTLILLNETISEANLFLFSLHGLISNSFVRIDLVRCFFNKSLFCIHEKDLRLIDLIPTVDFFAISGFCVRE